MHPVVGDDNIGNVAIHGGRKQRKACCCIPGNNPDSSGCKSGKKRMICYCQNSIC